MIEHRDITINDGGIDKIFRIKEFDAWTQKDFVLKLAIALTDCEGMDAGIDNGDWRNAIAAIYRKLTERGFASFRGISFERVNELSDMLLSVCTRVIDNYEQPITPRNVDKLKTLLTLQGEVIKLNFSAGGWSDESGSQSPQSNNKTEKEN